MSVCEALGVKSLPENLSPYYKWSIRFHSVWVGYFVPAAVLDGLGFVFFHAGDAFEKYSDVRGTLVTGTNQQSRR